MGIFHYYISNFPFPSLTFSSLEHLWDDIQVGKITGQRVRAVKRHTTIKKMGEELVETSEIEGAHGLPIYSISLISELQQVFHGVGKIIIVE